MKTSELLFFIAFGGVAAFIVTMMIRDSVRKRQIKRALTNRNQNDDGQFRKFFPDPKRADIAVRTRRVLANNLKLPLSGLTPSDQLEADLNAQLPANPDLFWDLEEEFGMKTDVEDLDRHEKAQARLVTFQDLVEYVEHRMTARSTEPAVVEDDEKSSLTYDLVIRCAPALFIGGFVTVVVGILIQKRLLMNLGGLIFMSGAAVWGVANGGEMLRSVLKSSRSSSWKGIAARPWPLILVTGLALCLLWFGGTLVWGILKNLLSSR
jgi:acyl carrier protein